VSGSEATALAAFGQLLRRCRHASGLSQEELAERAGVGVRTICDLERGRRTRPYRQTVGSLAEALGLRGAHLDEFVRLSRQGRGPTSREREMAPGEFRGEIMPQPTDRQPGAATVPRQLPAAVTHFTGRAAELDALTRILRASGTRTVVISALAGTAGVGKTATAVHWAHQVSEHFHDGQLYVNLRGYDPDEPVSPADALAGFLRALGVPGQDIPDRLEERSALYRSSLAGRRMLVVLDNAREGEQLRPLLPGDPGCMALITSRDALAGLIATCGAVRLDMDVLPQADAVGLLRSLIGPRADNDPQSTVALAGLCARLPLALRIAAELATARPETALRELVGELAAARLDGLDAGEDRADVRAVFSWSVRHLPGDVATAFALIGLHPGGDMDTYAAAALAGTSTGQARRLLSRLDRASLIQAHGPGRYGMHDLLRAYARELEATRDSGAERQAALTRLIDYYLHAAGAAMDGLFPAERSLRPPLPAAAARLPALSHDPVAARTWLDAERANLAAMAPLAVERQCLSQARDLAATLHRYLDKGGYYPEAAVIHECARQATRRTGDRAGQATALVNLATVDGHQGRYEQAAAQLRQALPLFADIGDLNGQARALGNLGVVDYYRGHITDADRQLREALAMHQQAGDVISQGRMLANLGTLNVQLGRYRQAKRYLLQALAICEQTGNLTGKAHVLGALGEADRRSGHHRQAARRLQQALDLSSQAGDRAEQARIQCDLGLNALRLDRPAEAIVYLESALELAREIGDQSAMVQAYAGIGEVRLSTDQPVAALLAFEQALALASRLREEHAQARAHEGLGNGYQASGDSSRARSHWQRALTLYSNLGVPEADQVRAQLAAPGAGH